MRMKFLRILPETWARTRCLFSSSTRNMALGNGSITVAITSMASSFELPESSFFLSSNGFAICSWWLADWKIGHYILVLLLARRVKARALHFAYILTLLCWGKGRSAYATRTGRL